ncbi:TBC-domain-containing protein, partial [Backusella circina FSU 941]
EQTVNSEEIDWGFWEAVIQDFDQVALRLPHLLSFKLRAGIPTRVRGLMWQAMSKSASLHLETVYGQLCNEKSPHERIIQRDLSRTFPRIDMFKQENGQGQASMKRILEAYSLYDLNVGYCQGLAFLVGPLLMNMSETQAFCVFVRLMETYEMRSMFTLNMEGLQLRLYQFSRLFAEILPELSEHFDKNSVHATIYASPWFLTLFAYAFPINLVSRIYDIIFAEGAAETIMRVAIAMLKRSQDKILQEKLEFEDILDFVTSRKLCEPYTDNYSDVIKDAMALSGIITRDKMDKLSESYVLDENQVDKSKRTEQVLAGRFNFWKRRNSKKKKSVDLKRSASAGTPILKKRWSSVSSKDWSSSAGTSPISEQPPESSIQRTSFSSLRSLHNTATLGSGLPPTPENNNTSMKGQTNLSAEFIKLKKEHQLVLEELLEVKYDNQDLECERDALKLTILELERRYYSENNKNNDRSNQMFDYSASSHSSTIDCDDSTLNMSISPADDGSDEKDLHSELVHTKVKNFELQQQYEKLQQELENVQAKFDMVNEGQMALVDKLITMKSDMDEVMNEKKAKDLEWLDATQENKMLKQELEKLRCTLHFTRLENNTLV